MPKNDGNCTKTHWIKTGFTPVNAEDWAKVLPEEDGFVDIEVAKGCYAVGIATTLKN